MRKLSSIFPVTPGIHDQVLEAWREKCTDHFNLAPLCWSRTGVLVADAMTICKC